MRLLALLIGTAFGQTLDSELDALPESMRKAVAKADADPKTSVAFWSWYRCSICQPLVDEGNDAIAHEKEKAKVAGVVNKLALYRAQEQVVAGRKCQRHADDAFKAWKLKPVACTSKPVADVAECLAQDGRSEEPVCRLQQIRLVDAPAREVWFTPGR
jgi:hypothetical protein